MCQDSILVKGANFLSRPATFVLRSGDNEVEAESTGIGTNLECDELHTATM
jgi:hypothetical protein